MINDYTIYDTVDMYMKRAFPIHETNNVYTKTPNRIHVNTHIYTNQIVTFNNRTDDIQKDREGNH